MEGDQGVMFGTPPPPKSHHGTWKYPQSIHSSCELDNLKHECGTISSVGAWMHPGVTKLPVENWVASSKCKMAATLSKLTTPII